MRILEVDWLVTRRRCYSLEAEELLMGSLSPDPAESPFEAPLVPALVFLLARSVL